MSDPTAAHSRAEEAQVPSPTLGDLIEALGPVLVQVEAGAAGLDVSVNHVVIHDPADALAVQASDLVLAVGRKPEDSAATDLVWRAGQGGAAAVVFRDAVSAELAATAAEAHLAVMSVAPEVTWEHLYGLARTALATAGRALGMAEEIPAGDLFRLANAVASMVGGPVTIEDPQCRVLAFSNLGHPVDEIGRLASTAVRHLRTDPP